MARINGLKAGVTASTFFDGEGYRLSLTSDHSAARERPLGGRQRGGPVVHRAEQVARRRDRVRRHGVGSGAVVTSSTNTFSNVVSGVDLTVVAASNQNVSVTVAASPTDITSAVQDFVDAYNSIRSNLDTATDFNSTDFSTGMLFGTSAALRVDQDLSHVVSSQFFGVGSFDVAGGGRHLARQHGQAVAQYRQASELRSRAIRLRCKSCSPIRPTALLPSLAMHSIRSWATTIRSCQRKLSARGHDQQQTTENPGHVGRVGPAATNVARSIRSARSRRSPRCRQTLQALEQLHSDSAAYAEHYQFHAEVSDDRSSFNPQPRMAEI